MRFAPLIIILKLMSVASTCFGQQRPAPRFEDYGSEVCHGVSAPVLFTNSTRLFRTRLTEASREPPNFAGRYRFAVWGCGSNCAAGALVDLQTGNIFAPPHDSRSRVWTISSGMFEGSGIDFRVDSRLVIIRAGFNPVNPTNAPDTYYFLWDGTRFRQIL